MTDRHAHSTMAPRPPIHLVSAVVGVLYADDAGLELCPLRRATDYRLDDPEVLRLAVSRGGPPPADEPVVAPSDLLASPLLVIVGRG